jgi:hypothetical protein
VLAILVVPAFMRQQRWHLVPSAAPSLEAAVAKSYSKFSKSLAPDGD